MGRRKVRRATDKRNRRYLDSREDSRDTPWGKKPGSFDAAGLRSSESKTLRRKK